MILTINEISSVYRISEGIKVTFYGVGKSKKIESRDGLNSDNGERLFGLTPQEVDQHINQIS